MRTLSAFFMLIASLSYAQSNLDFDAQLRLKYSDSFIQQVKQSYPDEYNSLVSELKSSFEFVELNQNLKYPDLEPFDFLLQQVKPAPAFSPQTFSLNHYKFVRYENDDIIYRIPGTQKGVLIYSKNRYYNKN